MDAPSTKPILMLVFIAVPAYVHFLLDLLVSRWIGDPQSLVSAAVVLLSR